MNIIKGIKAQIFNYRLKQKVKLANQLAKENRYKYLVLNINGKPVVKHRNLMKQYCQKGIFKCSIETLERNALYKTY